MEMTPLTVLLLSALGGLFIAVLVWLLALVYALWRDMADQRRDTQANTAAYALRREMRQEMGYLREELRQEIGYLRKEMGYLRKELR